MMIVWLALSSILWGALIVGVGVTIQSTLRASGATRQWLWRGSAILLILPWLAAPFTAMLPHPRLGLPGMLPDLPSHGLHVVVAAPPIGNATIALPEMNVSWPAVLAVIVLAGWIWRISTAHRARGELRRILATSYVVVDGPAAAAVRIWSQKLRLKRRRAKSCRCLAFSFFIWRHPPCHMPAEEHRDLPLTFGGRPDCRT